MARKPAGIKLATQDGHAEGVDPQLCPLPGGGYALAVACDFGGRPTMHYFGPDPHAPGQLVEVAQPYVWASALSPSDTAYSEVY